jgi:hypothetical protein
MMAEEDELKAVKKSIERFPKSPQYQASWWN